ncbi:MAG: Rrf2 family transcriptional regulator [Candidatus Omnitrophota bacterium]
MKISSRLDYALSCAVILADRYEQDKPTPVGLIAKRECIEYDYVEQLLRALKRSGIVKSARGSKGGYVLSRRPVEITAMDIVSAVEKSVLQLVCERPRARRRRCVHFDDCRVKGLWLGLRAVIGDYLKLYTLKGLLLLRRKEKAFKK